MATPLQTAAATLSSLVELNELRMEIGCLVEAEHWRLTARHENGIETAHIELSNPASVLDRFYQLRRVNEPHADEVPRRENRSPVSHKLTVKTELFLILQPVHRYAKSRISNSDPPIILCSFFWPC